MGVNLSIKNVPQHIADQLRRRAVRHHRSLQGELVAILEESVGQKHLLTPQQLLAEIRAAGLKTPAEATRFVRADRDGRSRR
jgi:plasmid stability protein